LLSKTQRAYFIMKRVCLKLRLSANNALFGLQPGKTAFQYICSR